MFAYHASHASPTQGLLCKALPAQGLPCISSFGIFHPQESKATGGGAGCLPSSSTAALWSEVGGFWNMCLVCIWYTVYLWDVRPPRLPTSHRPWKPPLARQIRLSKRNLAASRIISELHWHHWVAESLADVLRPPFPGPNGGVSGYIWTKPSEFWSGVLGGTVGVDSPRCFRAVVSDFGSWGIYAATLWSST